MPQDREYTTRDKPAERGITINNILLTLVVLGGSVFGTVVTNIMSAVQEDVHTVKQTITKIQINDGVMNNEMQHVHEQLDKCAEFHTELNDRLKRIELRVFGGSSQSKLWGEKQ